MSDKKKWYDYIPHPVVMLFGILIFAMILSYLLPAGTYERTEFNGRMSVVPGTYHEIDANPVSFFDLFRALSLGFKTASGIIFVVLTGGILFAILEKTGMIENTVGAMVHKLGSKRRELLVVLLTFAFGMLGVFIGYENNIAVVPIAAVVSLAIGGDLLLAAGISVGAITVGFGLSPVNIYTVGTGHAIAELPLFSGGALRAVLCFLALALLAWYNVRYLKKITNDASAGLGHGLDTDGLKLSKPLSEYLVSNNNYLVLLIFLSGIGVMVFGTLNWGWHFDEISALFVIIAISSGIVGRLNGSEISETALKGIAIVAPGAFMVGYATSIREVLEMGQISDTICFQLAELMQSLPTYGSAIAMTISQSVINMFIPSGSGQALATLPIMIPLGELLGLTRQTTILAFQIGDGVTNLFNPALGGLIAMLSMCRVPFDRWLRFIFPIIGWIVLLAWVFLLFAVGIGYA